MGRSTVKTASILAGSGLVLALAPGSRLLADGLQRAVAETIQTSLAQAGSNVQATVEGRAVRLSGGDPSTLADAARLVEGVPFVKTVSIDAPGPAQATPAAGSATPAASSASPTPAATSAPAPEPLPTFPALLFQGSSVTPPETAAGELDRVAAALAERPRATVTLIGHTDNGRDETLRQTLSLARAEVVSRELADRGVAPERITTVGRADAEPVGDNRTREGRAQNRRVDIRLEEG